MLGVDDGCDAAVLLSLGYGMDGGVVLPDDSGP